MMTHFITVWEYRGIQYHGEPKCIDSDSRYLKILAANPPKDLVMIIKCKLKTNRYGR